MLRLPESAAGERVLFNGAELDVSRGKSSQPLDQLLALAERSCAGDTSAQARPGVALREADERRGFVACLDPSLDPESLVERARTTVTGAMPLPIGYTYAERRGDTTHFIRFASAEPADLGAMFPRDADAPGRDPAALPRPASSRRALSLRVAGQPYDAVVYLDGARGIDDLVAHYRDALPRSGWAVVADWKVEEGPGPRQASVVVQRAGVLALLVVAQDSAATSTTFVSMEANREQ
jgi:hypothetical protein